MNSFTVFFVGVDGVDIEDFTESGDFDDWGEERGSGDWRETYPHDSHVKMKYCHKKNVGKDEHFLQIRSSSMLLEFWENWRTITNLGPDFAI